MQEHRGSYIFFLVTAIFCLSVYLGFVGSAHAGVPVIVKQVAKSNQGRLAKKQITARQCVKQTTQFCLNYKQARSVCTRLAKRTCAYKQVGRISCIPICKSHADVSCWEKATKCVNKWAKGHTAAQKAVLVAKAQVGKTTFFTCKRACISVDIRTSAHFAGSEGISHICERACKNKAYESCARLISGCRGRLTWCKRQRAKCAKKHGWPQRTR